MIAKKNSRYDLERKRIVFFQVGLFTTGAFTLAAFTYKTPVEDDIRKNDVAFEKVISIEEDVKEIPKKETPILKEIQTPAPINTTPSVNNQQLPNESSQTIANTSIVPTSGTLVSTTLPTGPETGGGGIIDIEGEIIDIPTIDAQYIGGYAAMVEYISENLEFPEDARDMNIQGKVFVSFVVEKDGSVSNVVVERGVFKSIDREAARIVRSFPNWIPGEIPAGKVRTRVRLPITFVME